MIIGNIMRPFIHIFLSPEQGHNRSNEGQGHSNVITQGWVTNIVDKLEEKGLVHRLRSQDDRRVINIVTTDRGRSFYRKIKDLHEKFIIDTLDFLAPEEMNKVKCILTRIEEQLTSSVSRQSPVAVAGTDPK